MNQSSHKIVFCNKFNLDINNFSHIEEFISFESIETDRVLIKPGEVDRAVYFIVHGTGILYAVMDSGEVKNMYLQKQSTVITSLVSILENLPSKYYIEILAGSVIAKLSIDDFDLICQTNLDICNWQNDILKKSVYHLSFRLEGLLMSNAKDRFIEYYKKDPELFTTSLKKHIAGVLGITPNSLSRILSAK